MVLHLRQGKRELARVAYGVGVKEVVPEVLSVKGYKAA